MRNGFIVISIITAVLLLFPNRASTIEIAPRITDREIIEKLSALDAKIDKVSTKIDIEIANVRGDIKEIRADIRRLEEGQLNTNKRIDDTNKRIDELRDDIKGLKDFMLWGFGILFAGMFTLVGFVLWDRRTALSPAIKKNKELEEREERIEKALKEYAYKEPRLAEILRSMGLI